MCVHVCVTESPCCTAEINTTLKINYASIERRREERPDSFFLSAMWRHSKKATICKPGRRFSPGTKFADTLTLDFLASRILRNKCLFKHPIYNILLDNSPIWLKQMMIIISVLSAPLAVEDEAKWGNWDHPRFWSWESVWLVVLFTELANLGGGTNWG